jgi:2-polyprenyl-3-methyl-5-hydroxy-6-metoxy-1,4-benzoquinol methylase
MKLKEQRKWYEDWHDADKPDLPVEDLKQAMRLRAIEQTLAQLPYAKVLVIGCGQGDELELLKNAHVIAFDFSMSAVIHARTLVEQNHYLQSDAMHLPFSSGSFDLVISSEVIEHILEPTKMMQEIARVLVPGGHLLITTPNWQSFFGMARWLGEKILRRPVTSDDQPVDNWATPSGLTQLFNASGFSIVVRRGAWYFPPTGIGLRRLPDPLMARVFTRLLPLEHNLQTGLPSWGHMLVMAGRKTN